MGGACGVHGREAKSLRCFGGETLKEICCWKEQGVDGIILQVSNTYDDFASFIFRTFLERFQSTLTAINIFVSYF